MANVQRRPNKRERYYIAAMQLKRIFPKTVNYAAHEALALYAAVHRIEAEAHSFAERECNENVDEDKCIRKHASIIRRLDALLSFKEAGIPVFLNGDPRGYALKIESAWMKAHPDVELERDWGGHGILCPV